MFNYTRLKHLKYLVTRTIDCYKKRVEKPLIKSFFKSVYRPEMNLLLKNYFNAETETLLPKIMMGIVLFI